MNKFFSIILVFFCSSSFAQKDIKKNIFLSSSKTTFLIFDSKIDFFDVGSGDIALKKAPNKDNILKLKAINENFEETNLTVMTGENEYYSFILNYRANPDTLNYFFSSLSKREEKQEKKAKNKDEVSTEKLNTNIDSALHFSLSSDRSFLIGKRKDKMVFLLKGISVKENKLFIETQLMNQSNIDYDIDFLKFSIKNKKRFRKSILQETEIKPIAIYSDANSIKAGNPPLKQIFVFDKFTIPEKKELVIDLWEKNGDRNLDLSFSGDQLLNARKIAH